MYDTDTVRMAAAISKITGIIRKELDNAEKLAENRGNALKRIEALSETQPLDLNTARSLLRQIHAEAGGALGGPLAKDVVV